MSFFESPFVVAEGTVKYGKRDGIDEGQQPIFPVYFLDQLSPQLFVKPVGEFDIGFISCF
jgi:hypothetical protein